jgi:hypothetical protein
MTYMLGMSQCLTVRIREKKGNSSAINSYLLLTLFQFTIFRIASYCGDRLCGLVVRVLGYRSGGPGSIPGTTRKTK